FCADAQTVAFFATLVAAGLPPIVDLNDLVSDRAIGGTMPSFTTDADHTRSSVRDRLVNVNQSESNPYLQFALDTLATRILLCNSSSGTPTAYGVEIAPGAALPVASNFQGKAILRTENITVRREVIIFAGVFQSPQLATNGLMLSGIGNSSHLQEFGITPILDLPGVGNNLQDHDEISIIWRMKQNFSLLNGCVLQPDPAQDPCLEFWEDNGHLNAYSFGGTVEAFTSQSADSSEHDLMTHWEPAYFPGFIRGDLVSHDI
ncbi:GMC oxidoreductase-domain-containing protein, partial [Lentinula detonsa]